MYFFLQIHAITRLSQDHCYWPLIKFLCANGAYNRFKQVQFFFIILDQRLKAIKNRVLARCPSPTNNFIFLLDR